MKGWIIPLVLIQSHSIEVYITSYKRNIVQSVVFRWHILRVCRTLYYHELECVNWTGTDLPISNTVRSLCAIHKTFLKMLWVCVYSDSLKALFEGWMCNHHIGKKTFPFAGWSSLVLLSRSLACLVQSKRKQHARVPVGQWHPHSWGVSKGLCMCWKTCAHCFALVSRVQPCKQRFAESAQI